MKTRVCCISALVSLLFITCATQLLAAPYPFEDDLESGFGNWTVDGLWDETTLDSHSASHALTDSPGRFYTNATDNAATLNSALDLSGATSPVLTFYHRHSLEAGYDEATVEVSTDSGSSWVSPALATYSGNLGNWTREQLDLSAYAGQSDVRIRFRLQTDGSIVKDGWYVDDVAVGEAPAAVGTFTAFSGGTNSVDLSWTASAGPDLASYRLYRSLQPGIDWRTGTVIAELGSAVTSHTDIAVSPKTTYTYRLMALDTSERHTLSAKQSATTAAGMDYPFLDNGEGGVNTWNAEAPWALSDEDALSATHAWSDSPGTNYENSVNASLTLAAPMDLSSAVSPALCFAHKHDFASGDSGNAEVSLNGSDWTSLEQFGGSSGGAWLRARYDLSAYIGEATVYVRLRFTSDHANVADGWHVDDISVAESPATIEAPLISNVQSHSLRLTWTASTNDQFSHYVVYQSTASDVDFNDTLAATISDRATATCVVLDLALDTEYYFRVYAVSTYATYSAHGSENHAHTENHPVPFTEDFEGSLNGWNITGTWAVDTNNPHAGLRSLADSPNNATYPPSSYVEALTAVDLRGTSWPVLRFWDRFELGTYDTLGLEISKNGTAWTRLYGMRDGSRTDWREQIVDLSPWQGEPNVRIRFWRRSNADASVGDGWFVDDVTVEEHTPVSVSYPYYDEFENGFSSNWLHAGWASVTNEAHDGTTSLRANDTETSSEDYAWSYHQLELAAPLDLAGAVNPQLTLWVKGYLALGSAQFRVHVSTDNGASWTERTEANFNNTITFDWTRVQCDLTTYANQSIRVRLEAKNYYRSAGRIWVDGLAIEERTPNALLHSPTPHLKSADLSWDVSALGAAFKRYELYRDINPTVTLGDTLIGTFTDINTTNLTDTGLSIGQTYYYRLFVVNTNDTYSLGSERQITTVPLTIGFTDPMDNLDQWDATGAWGPDSSAYHSSSNCISDTPAGLYQPSTSGEILTAVDLRGTSWPVLRFWDRFELGTYDSLGLEVSPNGTSWTRLYGMREGSRTDWREQIVDLSPWRGQPNLRIRFWRRSNGDASVGDGWFVDDVTVEEHSPTSVSYPYYDGFENGFSSNWLHAGWASVTNEAHDGTTSLRANDTETSSEDYAWSYHQLELAAPLDLAGAVNPQLTLWVKGYLALGSAQFRVHVSTDNGVSWTERTEANFNNTITFDWTRVQCDLTPYANQSIRVRLEAKNYYRASGRIWVDGLAIEERTPDALLHSPTPHLKSADLSWDISALGSAFKRYELYRDVNANVTLADTLIGSFTDINTTNLTDTGLSIGQTYYYRLFVVNTNDTYSLGSERQITTVPLTIGFTDPMDNPDRWDVSGDWGPDGSSYHSSSNCISDSPGRLYQPGTSGEILTAVDLRGTSWPVLRFWDRFELGTYDTLGLEVSPNGTSWTRLYGMREGSRTDWREQIVDLSPWQGEPNVRIRFWRTSNGDASVGDGWFVDDVTVEEYTPATVSYPYYDGFETGFSSNWLHSGWAVVTNDAYDGTTSLRASDTETSTETYSWTHHQLELAAPLDLAGAVNPQLTLWVKGTLALGSAQFRVYVSTDNGVTWAERTEANFNNTITFDWTRVQCDLTGYANQSIRVRLDAKTYYRASVRIWVDDLAIEERTPDSLLRSPTPHLKSADLSWDVSSSGAAFKRYELYRDVNANVTLADTLIASFTDINTTNLTDTGLLIGETYYYRLFVVNTNETYSIGSERQTTTVPLAIGFTDPMDDLDQWDVSGDWGPDSTSYHSSSNCISDSPGELYQPSSSGDIRTSVDLRGTSWPILRFWDRFELGTYDTLGLEISKSGTAWTRLYGMREGSRTDWREQIVDLSPWQGEPNVRIRFWRSSNNDASVGDGWLIDDVTVEEHTPVASVSYPYYDGFENGLSSNWLHSGWSSVTDEAHAGTTSLRASDTEISSEDYAWTYHQLELAAPLDLAGAVDPRLTFWIKGTLAGGSAQFRVHVSTDNGVTWTERSEANRNNNNTFDWTKVQCDLTSYVGQSIRVRLEAKAYYRATCRIWLDGLGIGEPTPGTPALHSPIQLESVPVLRPTLRVYNAPDYQDDALDYAFEIYSDAALSNLVSSVPAVAQGVNTTAWTVDTDLPDGAQYWWRCRGADAGGPGPWMDTAVFYVNHVNSAPLPVVLVGPPPASILHDLSHVLSWRPTSDPDTGGIVENYHLQIAPGPAFTNLVVNDATIVVDDPPQGTQWSFFMPLSAFSGSDSLIENTSYFWRMRASDQWDAWSDWSTNELWFIYGTPPPNITRSIRMDDGTFDMGWERSGKQVTVEFSPSLDTPDWQTVSGPIYGTNATVAIPSDKKRGYFRVKTE